jgi:hypothetical protein
VLERRGERLGQVGAGGELQPGTVGHEHGCEGASERLPGGLRQRPQRRRERERLAEQLGDPEQRGLLCHALLVLLQQARDAQRKPDLPCDRLRERDLLL